MLKHLRQRGLMSEFQSLSHKLAQPPYSIQFEHPLISQLHESLVVNGDFDQSEQFLAQATDQGLFAQHLSRTAPKPHWTLLSDSTLSLEPGSSVDGETPPARGGHQLIYLPSYQSEPAALYLFGGYDGKKDLADFWRFDLARDGLSGRWHCLSHDTSHDGPVSAAAKMY